MSIRTIIATLTLSGLISAAHAAPPIEEAYEVAVSDLTLPSQEYGSVILRQCGDCERITLRVDGATRYFFNGNALPLKDFRAFVIDLRGKDEIAATVIYRVDDRRVLRVHVAGPTDSRE